MLNKTKHQLIMGRILKELYTDISVSPLLGFKGGTCSYFFYELPRFSVDLDFDLFVNDQKTQEMIFNKIQKILEKFGDIKDAYIKKYTIFCLLSYGEGDRNIKVEISTRLILPDIKSYYEFKEYLGIPMLVARQSYLFAGKLHALTARSTIAMRDIYDLWFFAKNNWSIDEEALKSLTGKNTKEHLTDCIKLIEQVKESQLLQGLGELLSEEEKRWVKTDLKKEVVFLLRNYQASLGGEK